MTRHLILVICGLSALVAPLSVAAQNATSSAITRTTAPYDWHQIVSHFENLAGAIETSSTKGASTDTFDPAALQDFRIVCSEPLATFARRLIFADCADPADCASRRSLTERVARTLADEVSTRLDDEVPNATTFLRPGMDLRSSMTDQENALSLRSAHDQWFRAWLDPKMMAQAEDDLTRDEALMLNRVWCDMTRDNAEAAARYIDEFGFPSDTPGTGQGHLVSAVVNIAIHAAWNPELTAPLRAASDQAFEQGRLSGYHAAYLVDVDTMAAQSEQRVGFLWACENGRAYPSPPLIDEAEAAELRRRYGLPPLQETALSRSRNCAL